MDSALDTIAEFEPFMQEAIRLAKESAQRDEVPVGAVVVQKQFPNSVKHTNLAAEPYGFANGRIVGYGRDRKIELSDPTAHAEVLALRDAAKRLGDWRLEDCALVVTLEPCPMCAGAALLSRIPLVVFGARNPKFGAIETQLHLLQHPGWNHNVRTIGGCCEQECASVLQSYFRKKRAGGDAAEGEKA